ncbi:MAG: DNRLRE domain-containing protein, partial [Chloroflexota bacterium]
MIQKLHPAFAAHRIGLVGLLGALICALSLLSAVPGRSADLVGEPNGPLAALTIPSSTVTPTLDGACDPAGEYSSALVQTFSDAGKDANLYLMHDAAFLYVCYTGLGGTDKERFTRVYLDTDNAAESIAEPDDLALQAKLLTGALSSAAGTGSYGYNPAVIPGWDAKTASNEYDQAEYAIPLGLTGGTCSRSFGLAFYHHWVSGTGDDYGWPSGQWYDQPVTWSSVKLAASPCPSADLALTKTSSQNPAPVNTNFTYTLTVNNNGPDAAYAIQVSDYLPAGITVVSTPNTCLSSGGVVTCSAPSLENKTGVNFTLTVKAPQAGSLINQARVQAGTQDPVGSNDYAYDTTRAVKTGEPICGGVYAPVQDTLIDSAHPGLSFGGSSELQINAPATSYALMGFELDGSVPYSATIQSAVLDVTLSGAASPADFQLQVFGVESAWNSDTASWLNPPDLRYGFTPRWYSPGSSTHLAIDVTNLVTLWATGDYPEQSLALKPAGLAQAVKLFSRESLSPPRLTVNCSFASPPLPPDPAMAARAEAGLARLSKNAAKPPAYTMGKNGELRSAFFELTIPAQIDKETQARAWWFIQAYSDALRLDPDADLLQFSHESDNPTTLVFRQLHHQIPVENAQARVQIHGDQIIGFSAGYAPGITLSPEYKIPLWRAEELALALALPGSQVLGETQLRYYVPSLIGDPDPQTHLVWQVNLSSGVAQMIDASNGALVTNDRRQVFDYDLSLNSAYGADYSLNCADWFFSIDDEEWCDEEDGCYHRDADADARAAAGFARSIYDWWRNNLYRDSYDNDGSEISLYIHVTNNGAQWKNAHYLSYGECFEFGEDMAVLDVMAHEFTHGVMEYRDGESSSNMDDDFEPGAVNESFSDIFAHFLDPADWTLGEDSALGAIRNMQTDWRDH